MISLADDPYSFLYIQQFRDVIETKLRSCPLLPAGGTATRLQPHNTGQLHVGGVSLVLGHRGAR